MFTVDSNFIGNFKTGDNINYNLGVLTFLYEKYNSETSESNKKLLVKPIVLINTAIIEAILYDFLITRIGTHTVEGVTGVLSGVLRSVRSKKIDRLEHYIAQVKKHDFFDLTSTNFYEALDYLRKLRNRIHIQNTKCYKPINEHRAFHGGIKISSEKVLEKVIVVMSEKYPRDENTAGYVRDFILPWDNHFT